MTYNSEIFLLIYPFKQIYAILKCILKKKNVWFVWFEFLKKPTAEYHDQVVRYINAMKITVWSFKFSKFD